VSSELVAPRGEQFAAPGLGRSGPLRGPLSEGRGEGVDDSPAGAFDVIVVGSGPAGHGAALAASRAGRRVVILEQEKFVGGACVTHGTIPSKTLRETALAISSFLKKSGNVFKVEANPTMQVVALMRRLNQVVSAYEQIVATQLKRAGVENRHGRVRILDETTVGVRDVRGKEERLSAPILVIATGSRPRNPPELRVDHEHVLDSDSILSMAYLPRSLAVLGSGVIACEYASIFLALGVDVTIIDRNSGPLGFLDRELSSRFTESFRDRGGKTLFGRKVASIEVEPTEGVHLKLDDGTAVTTDKVFAAAGRIANLRGLGLEAVGIKANERGFIAVDENCFTGQAGIYAAGDVIGPPSLAASSMEQGRRAVCHALGQPVPVDSGYIPTGVYTIPELASVGLTEEEARSKLGSVAIGRASFDELARGQIAAIEDGLLKLVVDVSSRRVVGVHVCGEGAAELVTVGQVAISSGWEVERFVETTFNFPTLAEAYRVAALDAQSQLQGLVRPLAPTSIAAE
jgi:NAD(P) transhydrogenase